MGPQRPPSAAVNTLCTSPRLWLGPGAVPCLGPSPHPAGWVGRRRVRQLLSSPQDKGSDGVKELDSMKSDRLRTVQLNVCKSEEVDKAAEVIRSSLEDPEKGKGALGQWGWLF